MRYVKTKYVILERPLAPQPPYYSWPCWWGLNSLSFHAGDPDKVVWEQEIPEASLVHRPLRLGSTELSHLGFIEVKREKRWGWLLHIELTHSEAINAWRLLYPDGEPNKVFENYLEEEKKK
jgi:hypothetical protein